MAKTLKGRISLATVDKLQPGEVLFDTELQGFGVRRQSKTCSYFVKTRVKGRQRWITIGPHGSPWTPQTARKEAAALLVEALAGSDRIALRQVERRTVTFNQAADAFFGSYANKLKPRTKEEYERVAKLYLRPTFGTFRIDAITRGDIERAHGKWNKRPLAANHALSVLSKIMSWAEIQEWRVENTNPCRGIQRYKSNPRERFLQTVELARLGKAIDDAAKVGSESPYALAAVKLLMLTGMRLNEALTLKWEYIDTERRMIFLPDSKTGAKPVQLSDPALLVLATLHRFERNPYVFVGGRPGQHLVNLQKTWRRLRKAAKLEGLRLHDLRHTFASVAGANGASLPMIGGLLGHKDVKTTSRYTHLATGLLQQVNESAAAAIATASGFVGKPANDATATDSATSGQTDIPAATLDQPPELDQRICSA